MIFSAYLGGRLGLILAGLLSVPTVAAAQVIEIDQSGAVTVYDGPATIRADGSVVALRAGPMVRRQAAPAAEGAALETRAAVAADLSPALIDAVAWRESRWHSRLVSSAGAIGEMQLMPGTARALGVDPFDSQQNYWGGATYLRSLMGRYDGNLVLALAAYNAGPGAVSKYGGVPPFKETQAYVAAILDRLSAGAAATSGLGR